MRKKLSFGFHTAQGRPWLTVGAGFTDGWSTFLVIVFVWEFRITYA